MIKDLIKLANHLDDKGLTKEADTLDSIIRKIAQDSDKICDSANGLDFCAGKIKRYILNQTPDKETVSLDELNEMFDFYIMELTGMVTVMKKGVDPELKNVKKFELSAEEYHDQKLNYNPFGMATKPIVKK